MLNLNFLCANLHLYSVHTVRTYLSQSLVTGTKCYHRFFQKTIRKKSIFSTVLFSKLYFIHFISFIQDQHGVLYRKVYSNFKIGSFLNVRHQAQSWLAFGHGRLPAGDNANIIFASRDWNITYVKYSFIHIFCIELCLVKLFRNKRFCKHGYDHWNFIDQIKLLLIDDFQFHLVYFILFE